MTAVPLRAITDALNNNLVAAAISPEIAWPNRVYSPKKGISYLSVESAARSRRPLGFGADSVQEWNGIYQISVFVPRDSGDREQDETAMKILNAFPRGLNLSTNGTGFLTIAYSTAAGPVPFGDWSNMPVNVGWFVTEVP